MANILVTGGAGYIGSHTVLHLIRQGHDVTVVDNLSRGHRHNVDPSRLVELDIADSEAIGNLLTRTRCDAVVHFAALIAVGESMREPERYFRNNTAGTLALLDAMVGAGVHRMVFSSTAAAYGNPESSPIPETAPRQPVSAYGESKVSVERALEWLDRCRGFRSVTLRYFNACGAEPGSGLGEEHDPETHLIPLLFRAVLTGEPITIFGDDYPTPDGTCIRDYIHVSDLAEAHVVTLESLLAGGESDLANVGTGRGYSVMEVLESVERVTARKVPHRIGSRREGDPPELVANSDHLRSRYGWQPHYTSIDDIVATAWEFAKQQHEGKSSNGN